MNEDLAFASGLDVAKLIREREISPVELVELYLRRIDKLNSQLGSYFTVAADQALDAARLAEAELGHKDLPQFHGVPIAIKDLNDTAGVRTTYGSAMFADHVPASDDAVVSRLKAAGFIVLGKTNTPEFGTSQLFEPPDFPASRNPWDPARSSGTSSGGSAAAVAAGMCAIAQGSDAGGSIRMPASCCGVVGLKPARGRISNAPRPSDLFWMNGPLSRTVADAAAMLDVLAGYEWGDAWWTPEPSRPFLQEISTPPGRLRIAFSTGGVKVAEGNRVALETGAKLLAELGHTVEEADPGPGWTSSPEDLSVDTLLFGVVGVDVAHWPGMPSLDEIDIQKFDPCTRFYIEGAKTMRAVDYRAFQTKSLEKARQILPFFERYDLFLTPSLAKPPLLIEAYRESTVVEILKAKLAFQPFQMIWNITGQPAISLPVHIDELGLPAGIQLVGRPADESTLLRVSAQLEEARPWRDLRPPAS